MDSTVEQQQQQEEDTGEFQICPITTVQREDSAQGRSQRDDDYIRSMRLERERRALLANINQQIAATYTTEYSPITEDQLREMLDSAKREQQHAEQLHQKIVHTSRDETD